MLNEIKKASKHSVIYGFGNIAPKIIGLILIPLYTNPQYLSQAEYGALAVLEATTQLLIGILTMAMVQGLTRWYWDARYVDRQKSIFFTTLVFILFTVIPISGVLLFISEPLSLVLFKSSTFEILIRLSIINAGLKIINNQILCLAKLQSRSVLFTLSNVAKLLLILGYILYGIILKGRGLNAIWEAYVLGEGLVMAVLIPYALKNSNFKFQTAILREMIIYGLPLMFASVSGIILAVTDRYMLNSMSGLEQTGVFSLGLRIASVLKFVLVNSLALALSPIRMQKMNDPDNRRFFSKINTYTTFVFIIALLVISLFSLEFLKIFTGTSTYWAANGVIPILSFSYLFGLMKDNVTIGLSIKKRTVPIGFITFFVGILNISLNLVFIKLWDIYGAALATLIAQMVFFTAMFLFAQKTYSIPYELKKIFVLVLISAGIVMISFLITDWTGWIRFSLKVAMLAAFPLILYLFNFYEQKELEIIGQILRTWYNPKKIRENIKRFLN